MVPLIHVIPFEPMAMPMVPLALPIVQLVPLVSQWNHCKITNGTIGRTPNRALFSLDARLKQVYSGWICEGCEFPAVYNLAKANCCYKKFGLRRMGATYGTHAS